MSNPKPASIRNSIINALIGLVATVAVLIGSGAWASKEDAADHKADLQRVEKDHRADMQRIESLIRAASVADSARVERILDALCPHGRNEPRVCR